MVGRYPHSEYVGRLALAGRRVTVVAGSAAVVMFGPFGVGSRIADLSVWTTQSLVTVPTDLLVEVGVFDRVVTASSFDDGGEYFQVEGLPVPAGVFALCLPLRWSIDHERRFLAVRLTNALGVSVTFGIVVGASP